MRSIDVRYNWVAALLLATCAGCGRGDGPELAPAGGEVRIDGKPAPNIAVVFHPTSGPIASGKTNAEGKFTLSTRLPNDGAMVGNHVVTLVFVHPNELTTNDAPTQEQSPISLDFGQEAKSGLTATVKSGESNTFRFDLSGFKAK